MMSLEPLRKALAEIGLTTKDLRKYRIQQSVIDAIDNDYSITLATIEKICKAVGLPAGYYVEYVPEKN